uniref:CYP716 family cytochrome P450 monooxygenase n=1 Tax=Lagerstroemia speciosa TaxID=122810 RepID=A0A3S9W0N2_LAGSP|nr:CYP716 family cytochrome P450 monooxygenase [Lagerstroemia speciosa]
MFPFTITPALILLAPILFLLVVAKLGRRRTHHNLPPGSSGWPVIGESLDLLGDNSAGVPEKFVLDRVKRYGSLVFRTSLLGEPMVVVCGPAGNKLLFSSEGKKVAVWWPASVQRLIGPSLLNKTGEEARVQKKMMMSFFNVEALAKCIPTMEDVTRRHIAAQWQGEEEVKVYPTIKHYTFELACRLFMSIDEPDLISRLFSHFNVFLKGVISIHLNLPGTRFYHAVRASDAIREELQAVVRRRRVDMEKKVASPDQDILSYLLANPDETGKFMPEIEVVNNMLNLLFAGHDTSSSTITLIMKYLAELPRVHEKVLKEQREIAASKAPGELLSWEDLRRMRCSWNVVSEVMRMTPPVTGSFREALVDIELEGYTIPKGWKLLWSAAFTHKDPELYPNVTEFDESRFEGSGPPPFSYVPFGGGPRMCLGKEFARMEMLVFLHNVVNQFDWELSIPSEKIIYDPMPTPVEGLPIRLRPQKFLD